MINSFFDPCKLAVQRKLADFCILGEHTELSLLRSVRESVKLNYNSETKSWRQIQIVMIQHLLNLFNVQQCILNIKYFTIKLLH